MSGKRGTTIAIVQARSGSTRLPGKVLKEIQGEPMVLRQLERISRCAGIDRIVVATSTSADDDQLAQVISDGGYDCVRGSLDDVLGRFAAVLDTHECDVVVRLTADCPLASPQVIDYVIRQFHDSNADYVSNTMVPTYPDGLDVEVMTASSLRQIATLSPDIHEREHVTLGIYRRPDEFTVMNVRDPQHRDNAHLRWTVDSMEDFAFVREVYGLLANKPTFEYEDVLEMLDRHPDLNRTKDDSRRNAALDGLDTGIMQHDARGAS